MSFFEPMPPPPERPARGKHLPWAGPPPWMWGGLVPVHLLLARSEVAAVGLRGMVAYPTGVEFTLVLRADRDEDEPDGLGQWVPGVWHTWERGGSSGERELSPDVVRFGVRWPDGRKATNLTWGPRPTEDPPEGPRLNPLGGSGGEGQADQGYWLWPLPPEGPLLLACEWPGMGIPETRVELDGNELRRAAGRAVALWETDG